MAKGYGGVPSYYTPVEYIEGGDTQYIDTGVTMPNGYKAIGGVAFTKVDGQWHAIIGTENNVSPYGQNLIRINTSNYWCVEDIASSTKPTANTYYEFEGSTMNANCYLNVNSSQVIPSTTRTTTLFNKNLYIFANNQNGTAVQFGNIRLYYLKLYNENNVLVRDFIPVLDQDNVACLYEQIEGKLYYNKGSGSFIAGSVTGEPVYVDDFARKLKKGFAGILTSYTPVEYIESSGTQWIDMGVKPNQDTGFEIDFTIQNPVSTSNYGYILGAADSSARLSMNTYPFTSGAGGELYITTGFNAYITQNVRKQITYKNSVFLDNDGHTYTVSVSAFSVTHDLALFTTINSDGAPVTANAAKMKLYSFKLYDGNTLIRDFIPVLDDNNVACLYEQVEGKLYYNKGTGAFVAGSTTGQPVSIGDKARKIKKGYAGVRTSYTPVEYIESTGTQYIDTGYSTAQINRVVAEVYNTYALTYDNIGYGGAPFGARVSTSDSYFGYNNGAYSDFWGNGNGQVEKTRNTNTAKMTIDYSKSSFSMTCGGYSASDSLSITINTTLNIFLFGLNNNGTPGLGTYKIVTMKFFDVSNNLVADFIPVLDQDGVACLYEQVEDKFYYNKGTGTFAAGSTTGSPVVIGDKARLIFTAIPAYTPLSYIEGNGTQYIDTEVFINDNTCVDVKFAGTRSSSNDYLCGADNPLYHIGGISGHYLMVSTSTGDYSKLAWADDSIHTIVYNDINKKIKYDGSIYQEGTAVIPDSATSMYLFTKNPASGTRCYTKVYYCKISNRLTGELYRDLVPAIRQEDGVVCLFDKVSNKFFVNKGTGNFIAGPIIT